MKHNILKEYSWRHEGNDCLICDCVSLIEVTDSYYIVLHTTDYICGWAPKTITQMFEYESLNEAEKGYKKRIS